MPPYMFMKSPIPKLNYYLALPCYLFSHFVSATITELQPLDFGTIVTGNNNTVSEIRISPQGDVFPTNQIWIHVPGSQAIFELTDFPAFQALSLSTVIIDPQTYIPGVAPATEHFQFIAAEVASTITTNGSGIAYAHVGGTMRTTGNGSAYINAAFNARYQLNVSY